ncbi:WD40 repeat-like protein [Staphylotrichum tortipilum]|uniref:WD40 repeat-like protein n=1 Tax=Staphylotrichum tortipilum TaxID=2831512 RepID=A0AAN6RSR9_9PEZI|nr:WD40 repeat-like protein [Staphylotrichum longicolle]
MLVNVPFRPQARRRRHAYSSPDPPSPLDSGYGSASSPFSPLKRTGKRSALPPLADLRNSCDGNQSDSDDPFVESDHENTLANVATALHTPPPSQSHDPSGLLRRSATLPRRTPRARPVLPPSFHPLPHARLQQRTPNHIAVRHLDRFIPARTPGPQLVERFKTHKAPHELTTGERVLRHGGASEDAFVYRRRVVTPLGVETRAQLFRAESAASRNEVGSVLGPLDQNSIDATDRPVDTSPAWTVGLGGTAVNNGRGQLVRSGTNAPLFRTTFPTAKPQSEEELDKHSARLAAALGLDRAQRVLQPGYVRTHWNGIEWVNEGPVPKPQKPLGNRTLPTAPFKVLDAPNLRDDFYCSILAYSATSQTLAVGLGNLLYGWSEARGVQLLNAGTDPDCHLTSLSFSSDEGCKSILAFGRSDKTLGLMSLYDDADPANASSAPTPRFDMVQPAPVACLSWKPVCTIRPSQSRLHPGVPVKNEDLLVGDEVGLVYYYAVEWPERWEVERHDWAGQMTLLARVVVHSQQICGLAWSRNGDSFATGGNDNMCYLFETSRVLGYHSDGGQGINEGYHAGPSMPAHDRGISEVSVAETEIQTSPGILPHDEAGHLGPGDEKHRWVHGAAVKALAFCPWQDSLLATGGGSNDKCIHFFHTGSGAALASISVSAQVTSLIWSTTRREIAATFGYAQPDHPVRIAVFSWPECRQVAAIPWAGEHRALYAIPYPCGPEDGGRRRGGGGRAGAGKGGAGRTAKEGCIVVASSDKSVKFHEVWAAGQKGTAGVASVLGGSPILEFLEGIDREGEVIR